MDTKITVLTLVVVVLLIVSVLQFFQLNDIKGKISATGAVVQSTGGALDMTGWTENEKMMYEHHGTLPARLQSQASPPPVSTGMVGGC
ncbi:MAG: hypothetical protein HY832_02580 [Candidatus Aenigmarchaeota archaeon]|nr:hypothetical protein [Candidatus Aenigmarchaeota archaeon]